ncbi:MAG TPA: response regulator [Verrucomicrobiae bacterium]|nr:response regulator [Verrucomicrobiae bacterium]
MTLKSKTRVLIVDDEPGFTRLLKLNFHHTGRYMAEVENDATEAVRAAERFSPDIVLLDVMMPGLDGSEVADRLHSMPRFHNLPIIFLTAAVKKQEVASRGGLCGGIPFVAKPVEFQEVLHHVEAACNQVAGGCH